MNTKEALHKLNDMKRFGYIDEAGRARVAAIVEDIAAEAAALRDHLDVLIAVMVGEEGNQGGPFTDAAAFLANADIGGAELDYRRALEGAAARVIGQYVSDPKPELADLAAILDHSPALFLRANELEQFLDQCADEVGAMDLFSVVRKSETTSAAERSIKAMVVQAVLRRLNITVEIEERRQGNQRLSPQTISVNIDPVGSPVAVSFNQPRQRDRLDDLLSDAADEAMNDEPTCREMFEDSAVEYIRQQLSFHFERVEEKGGASTEFGITARFDP